MTRYDSRSGLSILQTDVLRMILLNGPCIRYKIYLLLNDYYENLGKKINHQAIYKSMDALIKKHYIAEVMIEDGKSVFGITEMGKRELSTTIPLDKYSGNVTFCIGQPLSHNDQPTIEIHGSYYLNEDHLVKHKGITEITIPKEGKQISVKAYGKAFVKTPIPYRIYKAESTKVKDELAKQEELVASLS